MISIFSNAILLFVFTLNKIQQFLKERFFFKFSLLEYLNNEQWKRCTFFFSNLVGTVNSFKYFQEFLIVHQTYAPFCYQIIYKMMKEKSRIKISIRSTEFLRTNSLLLCIISFHDMDVYASSQLPSQSLFCYKFK